MRGTNIDREVHQSESWVGQRGCTGCRKNGGVRVNSGGSGGGGGG